MTNRLSGRTYIVTGGSRGIGRAVAHRIVGEGGDVAITGRDREGLERAARSLSRDRPGAAIAFVADMGNRQDLEHLVAEVRATTGRIDGLVNNAGVFSGAGIRDTSLESWNGLLAVNLTGAFYLLKLVAETMVALDVRGAIVNVASIDGHAVGGPDVAYGVSKAGLIQLTRYAAVEFGPFGIRCNSVSPGITPTDMVRASLSAEDFARLRTDLPRAPVGSAVSVDEVAQAIVFLLSDESKGITGVDVAIDHGMTADLFLDV